MTENALPEVRANGEAEGQGREKDVIIVDSETKEDATQADTANGGTCSLKPLSKLQAILLAGSVMLTYSMMVSRQAYSPIGIRELTGRQWLSPLASSLYLPCRLGSRSRSLRLSGSLRATHLHMCVLGV
jgi:hypothetical protein